MADSQASQTFFPSLHYRDAIAAIEWLERAFGFERVMVVEGEARAGSGG
jgi:uncharacterized glyoxalase superfamily protein PhnB